MGFVVFCLLLRECVYVWLLVLWLFMLCFRLGILVVWVGGCLVVLIWWWWCFLLCWDFCCGVDML